MYLFGLGEEFPQMDNGFKNPYLVAGKLHMDANKAVFSEAVYSGWKNEWAG